jgi:hypothetical protein
MRKLFLSLEAGLSGRPATSATVGSFEARNPHKTVACGSERTPLGGGLLKCLVCFGPEINGRGDRI